MQRPSCLIRLGEVPLHLYQILAGFFLLSRQGIVDLQVEKLDSNHPDVLPYNMMEVVVNNQFKVLYDANDGYDNLLNEHQDYAQFMDKILSNFDLGFKRSFSSFYNSKLTHKNKLHPLGLNYMVTVRGNIAHFPMPNDPKPEKMKKLVRMIPFTEYYNGLYHVNSFEDTPKHDRSPRILFMARLWDVNGDYAGQISSAKKDERAYINEVRADCIRLCRQEFGDRFYGGVNATQFAFEKYPDLVLPDSHKVTKRNHYLKKVKESSICIATMGLHQSIGWKFAEYIAASKAIVTEEIHYEVPGDLRDGHNYLVFKQPEQCVDQIYKLLNQDDFRYSMMVNNSNYYREYVRPDRLVFNSLQTVLQEDQFDALEEVSGI